MIMGYIGGRIVRIKLERFLTYDSLELNPGPQLNLIVGPNGTGKSTLVCGICLGLAGKSNFTGRATQISDYIKHGYQSAVTEIELDNPEGRNVVIRREIYQDNSSIWALNGKQVTLKLVEKEVSRFNINTSNLCQFLPQERVADFSKMNPRDLLESTECAIGKENLYNYHEELKKLRAEYRNVDSVLKRKQDYVANEEQKNKRIETEVKMFKDRERHLEKIRFLQEKKPWQEYEDAREEYQKCKEEHIKLKNQLEHLKTEHLPQLQAFKASSKKVENSNKHINFLENEVKKKTSETTVLSSKIEEQNEKISEAKDELDGKKNEESTRAERLRDLRQQSEGWKQQYNELAAETGNIQSDIHQVNELSSKTQKKIGETLDLKDACKATLQNLKREIHDIAAKQQKLNDIGHIKLENLRRRNKNTFDAVCWLRENKGLFRKTVFEPILTQINVSNQQNIRYIETHIPQKDMLAFVCEDEEDVKAFTNILRDKQNLVVNVVLAPKESLLCFKPKYPIENFKKFGFYCYLKDLFTAPDPVMCYLCKMYKVHETPVGTSYTQSNISKIIDHLSFLRFYTPERMYSTRYSRYGDKCGSHSSQELMKLGLLFVSQDATRLKELEIESIEKQREMELQNNKYTTFQEEENKLQKELEDLRKKKKDLTNKKDMLKSLQTKIEQKDYLIQNISRQTISIEEEERKTYLIINSINRVKCDLLEKLYNHLEQAVAISKKIDNCCFHKYLTLQERKSIEEKLEEYNSTVQDLEKNVRNAERIAATQKKKAHELRNTAKKTSGIGENEELSDVMKQSFLQLPNTLAEIDAEIYREQSLADCLFQTDGKEVVKQHSQRKRNIIETQKEIDNKVLQLEEMYQKIENIKLKWLPPLENLIQKVSLTFSKYFASLGCAGEITLKKSENPDDFDKYGLSIKVKYRDNEPLNELSQSHHSGGECSVATILFILSLQKLTEVPFRCVDEINQGMDSTNERRVFELIVNSACNEHSSQYFLLTPKLLPDLNYSPKMQVLIIHNGASLKVKWDLKEILERRSQYEPEYE